MTNIIEMSSEQIQMNTYRSFVSLLIDPNAKDESKLKAAQELGEDLEVVKTL
jgi:transformation/transcription domain-associated protein